MNHLTDYRDIHLDTIGKMNYIQSNHMADFLNANIEYTLVNTWGYQDKMSGNWSGMIGELVRNEADVGATACFYTIERIPFIDYVAMTTKSKSLFVFRSPKLSFTDNIFLLPFTDMVWLCILFIVPTIGISLTLVTFAEYKLESKKPVSKFYLKTISQNLNFLYRILEYRYNNNF